MAIADTARLIASLELQDKFSRTAANANRSLGQLEGASGKAARGMGFLGHTISTALGVGLLSAVGTGFRLFTSSISGAIEQEKLLQSATAQTNAVLTSTGGVSGQTADGVRAMAEQFENVSALIDDKVIQAGENMLLTFTNIGPKAFKPATQAILDMNTALGEGPEGLTNTAIRVGKALNDPIRGVTALRRVGVQLTEAQEKQIKTLVKNNDLYGAQQIILKELGREFGGSFAASGKTAAGTMAALHDSVEDLQLSFGHALIPGLVNVAAALSTTFKDPAIVAGVQELGARIAGFLTPENIKGGIGLIREAFTKIVGIAKTVPWGAIGDALRLGGVGAKAILDAFLGMPSWVQTAVITGWGLNKLTGGALSGIVGSLASGLIKGILGINAAVVNINAATVNGGGGVPGAVGKGGGGLLLNAAKWVLGPAAAAAIGFEIGKAIIAPSITQSKGFEQQGFQAVTTSGDPAKLAAGLKAIDDELHTYNPQSLGFLEQVALGASTLPLIGDAVGNALPVLVKQRETLLAQLEVIRDDVDVQKHGQAEIRSENQRRASRDAAAAARTVALQAAVRTGFLQGAGVTRQTGAETRAAVDRLNARQAGIQASIDRGREVTGTGLARLAAKDFSPTVNVRVSTTANISISKIVTATTAFHIATGGMGGLTVGASVL